MSTGAHDDLQKATAIARAMVESYGMSSTLGQVSLQPPDATINPLLARTNISPATAREIDCEVRAILAEQHERAISRAPRTSRDRAPRTRNPDR